MEAGSRAGEEGGVKLTDLLLFGGHDCRIVPNWNGVVDEVGGGERREGGKSERKEGLDESPEYLGTWCKKTRGVGNKAGGARGEVM